MAKNLHLITCASGALVVFCMFGKKFLPLEPTEIYDVGNNGKLTLVLKFFFFLSRVSGFMGKLSLQAADKVFEYSSNSSFVCINFIPFRCLLIFQTFEDEELHVSFKEPVLTAH